MRTIDIAGHRDKRCLSQQLPRVRNATGGLERRAFCRIDKARAKLAAVTQRVFNQLTQMRMVDDDLGDARSDQIDDMPDDEWATPHRQQRLGAGVGEWAHPFAATRGKNHRFHQKV